MEKQEGWFGAVASQMNEVKVLAFHVGGEVGECVEAPFDRTPVVPVTSIRDEPLEVSNPNSR